MNDIVGSVERVHHIMNEITLASQEQSSGISQVNQAISHLDEVTQQNAALVEQATAAAASLEEQTTKLAQAVSVFKLAHREAHFFHAPAPNRESLVFKKNIALTNHHATRQRIPLKMQ